MMYSATALIVMYFIGTFTGAMVVFLFRKLFLSDTEKLISKNSSELQELVSKNAQKSYSNCQELHEIMQREADLTLSLQQEARKEVNSLILQIARLREEVQASHSMRKTLEDEITKLKNIIKRQNKKMQGAVNE